MCKTNSQDFKRMILYLWLWTKSLRIEQCVALYSCIINLAGIIIIISNMNNVFVRMKNISNFDCDGVRIPK